MLHFTKMHALGNNYLYFDAFRGTLTEPAEWAGRLSDIRTGIGSDGVILILPSERADAGMRIFNADGSEAEMCGNGIRCVGKYLFDRGLITSLHPVIETKAGERRLELKLTGGRVSEVTVDMGSPDFSAAAVPVLSEEKQALHLPFVLDGERCEAVCLSMGNPHAVFFPEKFDREKFLSWGPQVENDPRFPARVNAGFARVRGENRMDLTVWERGSGATAACGTGACAAVCAAEKTGRVKRNTDVAVFLPGGKLTVNVGGTVLMRGDAHFTAEIDVCEADFA